MKMYIFPKNAWTIIDRTEFDLSGIEFTLIKNGLANSEEIFVGLTEKGRKQYIERIKSRTVKFGEDDYLISLVIDESKGILAFYPEDDDSNLYNYLHNLTERTSQ